jgi:hypothetical protein
MHTVIQEGFRLYPTVHTLEPDPLRLELTGVFEEVA